MIPVTRFNFRIETLAAVAGLITVSAAAAADRDKSASSVPRFQFITATVSKESVDRLKERLATDVANLPKESVPPVVWTSMDGTLWIEQDALLRQREYVFIDDFVEGGEKAGVIVRPRSSGGRKGTETLLPLPEAKAGAIKRRDYDEDKGNSAWVPAGQAEWVVPAPVIAEGKAGPGEWKYADGRPVGARFESATPREAVFVNAAGRKAAIPLNRLGLREAIFARRWVETNKFTPPLPPRAVGVSLAEAAGNKRVAKEKDDRGLHADMHAYSTPHYDFWSTDDLGAGLQTVGMSFEATWKLLGSLDWSHPWPMPAQGKNKVRIFATDDAYQRNGGPPGSAGVFMGNTREFLVPRSSLALGGKVESTLHHEATHQCMQELLPCLPLWVAEGTAEYVGSLDFKKGQFLLPMGMQRLTTTIDLEAGLAKGQSLRGIHRFAHCPVNDVLRDPYWPPGGLDGGMRYRTSLLLVYYFLELERDQMKFLRFLCAARRLRDEVQLNPTNRRVLYNHYLVDVYNARVKQWNGLLGSGKAGGKSYDEMLQMRPPANTVYLWIDPKPGGDLDRIAGDNSGLLLKWEPPAMVPITEGRAGGVIESEVKTIRIPGGFGEASRQQQDPRNTSGLATLMRQWQTKYLGLDEGFEERFYQAYKKEGLDLRPGRREK